MPPQVKPNLGIGSIGQHDSVIDRLYSPTGLTVPGAGVNLDSLLREMEAKKQEYRWRNPQSMTAKKLNREDQQRQQYAQGAQAIGQEQLTQNIEGLGGTTGVEPIARGYMMAKDAASGVGQMLAGEAADALGLDPVSLTMHASEKTGINPWLLGAAGVGIFGAGKMKKLAKEIAEQKAGKVGAALGDLTGHPPHLDMPEGAVMHADPPAGLVTPARTLPGEANTRTKSIDAFGERFGTPVEPDIRSSVEALKDDIPGTKGPNGKPKQTARYKAGDTIPDDVLRMPMENRARLRAEPSTFLGGNIPYDKWTPKRIAAFGKKHGLDWSEAPMVPIKDVDPRTGIEHTWYVPGGLDMKERWNYVNLHQLKHAGIDPKLISPELHDALHHKMTDAMNPQTLTDSHVFKGLAFGLASPNVPLHDTQMILTRVNPKTKADWEKLASYTKGRTSMTADERMAVRDQMIHDYGLGGGYKGGSGNAATNDLARVSALANVFMDNPGMFRQQNGETIKQLAERMANIVPGLNMKTADMATVWQDILKANSAPMDRHMADLYMPKLEKSKLGEKWKRDALDAYNDTMPEGQKISSYKELKRIDKDTGFLGERLRTVINTTKPIPKYDKQVKLKSGKLSKQRINKQVPRHLRDLPGDKVKIRGDYYEGALKQNEREAIKSEMSLYQKQWQFWDAKRGQINPHESMHPDLERVPKMAWKDMQEANLELRKRGFSDNTGAPVTPGPWEKAFYYGFPGAAGTGAAAGLLGQRQEDRRE